MTEKYFIFDCLQDEWHEAKDAIAMLPKLELQRLIPVLECYEARLEDSWVKAWCPEHRVYEDIKEYRETEIITGTGCKLTGLPVKLHLMIGDEGFWWQEEEYQEAELCYKVTQSPAEGTVKEERCRVKYNFVFEGRQDGVLRIPVPLFYELKTVSAMRKMDSLADKQPTTASPKLPQWQVAANRTLQENLADIPPDILESIQSEGLTRETVDKMNIALREAAYRVQDISCSDWHRQMECKINGYNFRLIHSMAKVKAIGDFSRLNGLNKNAFGRGKTVFFGIERNGVNLGTVYLNGKTVEELHINHWRLKDAPQYTKLRIVCFYWIEHFNLERKYHRDEDSELALAQEFTVEPADDYAEWDNLGLMELMKLPQEERRPGYYLYLCRRLSEYPLLCENPPTLKDDEAASLTKKFPYVLPIFQAAQEGNAEAEYALSRFYRYSDWLRRNSDLMANKWYEKAADDGWYDLPFATPDVKIEGFV